MAEKIYLDRIQVFVSAPFPAEGVSKTFELASRYYPHRKALQLIMGRAMEDYDRIIESGRFNRLPDTFETDPSMGGYRVFTSRMMSRELYRIARAHFDPLGLESARSFGSRLATAALASFFMNEIKK